MLPRRLAQRALQAAAGALGQAQGSSAAPTGLLAAAGSARYNATGSYFSLWSAPAVKLAKQEVALARSMLPHRADFTPQFMPHGVQLMPERLSVLPVHAELGAEDEAAMAEGGDEATLQMDSVKRKRKLKMKRHKHRKRLKAMRHQK